jgi:ABC-type multidrug transport system fused ATPase/permease subunit
VRGAIHQVSAAASAGSLVRIEGANGSGKSTLLRVLSGLTRPDSGRVVVDGRDLSLCKLDSLRRQIGVVSPDLPLLRGTIRRNLTYRHPGASEAEVRELVAQLDLEGFLERCEQGLDSRVSEGGANLSAGQRQKIALGRALLGCPRILILDEPDVHLDAAGLRVLHSVIDSFAGTIFLVWHGADPPGADLVWTLRQGRLVRRRGTPAEEPARVVDLRGALRPISRSSEPLPPSDSVVEAVPARGR